MVRGQLVTGKLQHLPLRELLRSGRIFEFFLDYLSYCSEMEVDEEVFSPLLFFKYSIMFFVMYMKKISFCWHRVQGNIMSTNRRDISIFCFMKMDFFSNLRNFRFLRIISCILIFLGTNICRTWSVIIYYIYNNFSFSVEENLSQLQEAVVSHLKPVLYALAVTELDVLFMALL